MTYTDISEETLQVVDPTIVLVSEGVNKLSFYHSRLLFTLYHSAFLHSKTLLTFSPPGNLSGIILITWVPECFHISGSLTRIAMPTINTVSIVRHNNYQPSPCQQPGHLHSVRESSTITSIVFSSTSKSWQDKNQLL